MASPVSLEDVYLVGKLAFKISRAFTKGRKSAPAEFREVENQLYSLSVALCALDRARAEGHIAISTNPSELPEPSQPMQASGGDTKYSAIGKSHDSDHPLLKRWSRDLRDNWKKIEWTTEGGDLVTLRSNLAIHINSLNLVLGVVTNSQTNRLEDRVDQVSKMLTEIHEWFIHNLREATLSTQSTVSFSEDQSSLLPDLKFELYGESENGLMLICAHACLHPKWNDRHSKGTADNTTVSEHLFICRCNDISQATDVQPHQEKLAEYGLSPLSFPVRLTGKVRSWMLYKAADRSSNRLVSLTIKRVPLRNLAEFEASFINGLATTSARLMLGRGMSTMLAHLTPTAHVWRILHLTKDMKDAQKGSDTVTFTVGQRSYSRSSIEAINLLHYKALDSSCTHSDPSSPFSYEDSAEIAIFYSEKDSEAVGDVSSTTLHLKHHTQMKLDLDEATILLREVECSSVSSDEQTSQVSSFDVTFRFTTSLAAKDFNMKVQEMRMDLFVLNLQFPHKDEKTILKLQASQVQSEEIQISDAEVSIVQDTKNQRFRLIIVSRNGCSILSQELAEDFLSSLTSPGQRPNFSSPTYLIQMEDSGMRQVYHYAGGFKYLDFSSLQNDRLFELGLATIAGRLSI